MGNYHAGFLGGLGSEMTPGYLVFWTPKKVNYINAIDDLR
jgi:hypothetical protein